MANKSSGDGKHAKDSKNKEMSIGTGNFEQELEWKTKRRKKEIIELIFLRTAMRNMERQWKKVQEKCSYL